MTYHEELKEAIHNYVKFIYKITKRYPEEEKFGVISQIRRSSMSIILNYFEGYARRRGSDCKTYNNFMLIAYGSLKESKYLLFFSVDENYINKEEYSHGLQLAERIGKMLWPTINK